MGSGRIGWARPAAAAVGIVGLSALAVPGASASATTAAAGSGWRVVARANAALDVVITPSKTSFWAFGSALPGKVQGPGIPSGLHWNGHSWSRVTFPKSVKSGIGCADLSSAGNVWAFAGAGLFGDNARYAGALHLVKGKWQVSKSFTPAGLVSGCSVLGNGNAWVYGLTHVGPGVGTWRLRGHTWSRATTGKVELVTASEVRASDVWGIAADSLGSNDVVAHGNGHSWTRNTAMSKYVQGLGTTLLELQFINAVGPGNVYVAGSLIPASGPGSTIVLHLSDGTWHKVAPGSAGYNLADAVSDGHGGWWATSPPGSYEKASFLLHRAKGKSHWTKVQLPVPHGDQGSVSGLVRVPGSTAMVALLSLFNGTLALRTEVLAYGKLPK
jgi:hypothetical protein